MRLKKSVFREMLNPFGKKVYDFTLSYGIPATYFSRVLDMTQVEYNNKLKGLQEFTAQEVNIITSEMERIDDMFEDIKDDIYDIYVRKR